MPGRLQQDVLRLERMGRVLGFGRWEIDLASKRVTASESARVIYGLEGRELSLDTIQSVPLEEYRPALNEALSNLIEHGQPYNVEFKIRRPVDGAIADVESVAEYDASSGRVFGVIKDVTEQRKVENALRDSEHRYRMIAETSTDVIWTLSLEGKFTYVSPSVYQLRGFTPDEVLRQSIEEAVCPGSLQTVADGMKMAAAGIISGDTQIPVPLYEIEQPRKDGTTVWTEVSVGLVYEEGRPPHILGVSRDITERKQAEEALRRSLSELTATLEATADGILVLDLSGKVQKYSSRFAKMWGIPQEMLDAGDDQKIVEFARHQFIDEEGFVRRIKEIFNQPELSSSDVLLLKDGRSFERYSRPQRLDGEIVGRVWSFRDVTERKRMELRLLMAAEEWRATFDSIATPVSIQDRNFKIVRVNKAYAAALNTTPEALIGKNCYDVSHCSDKPVENCPHVQTLEKGISAEMELHNAERGTYTLVSTYPMFDSSGQVIATVHISQDITERKRMQEKLMVTDRLASVGELAAGIAHEINNPLTGVLGFSELVLASELPDNIRQDIETIHSEAQRAADVVKNLLTFARSHTQVRQSLSVNEVIEKVLALRAYEQKIRNIGVVTELDPELPEITADYFQLQQVFLNIVINAEYFMAKAHSRGNLVIATSRAPGTEAVRITFADNGPGIPEEILPRLFDPFFTTKEVGQGTGLGLSISHGIVHGHGGKIWAESEMGKGATFIIELPLSAASDPESPDVIA